MSYQNENEERDCLADDISRSAKTAKNTLDAVKDIKNIPKSFGNRKQEDNNSPNIDNGTNDISTEEENISSSSNQKKGEENDKATSGRNVNQKQNLSDFAKQIKNEPKSPNKAVNQNRKKKKAGNKKQDSKKESDKKKKEKKKKKKKQKSKRLRRLRIKIITSIVAMLLSIIITVSLFIISNPVILMLINVIQLLSSLGCFQWIADISPELWESYQQGIEAQIQMQQIELDMWLNLFDKIAGVDTSDADDPSDVFTNYEIGEWNPEDEYYDSLMVSYDLCKEIGKKAYSEAKKEAKQEKRSLEGNGATEVNIVDSEGSDLSGKKWDYFYDTSYDTNWGDVIAVLDICFAYEKGDISSATGLKKVDYDPKELEEYILNDHDNLKHLYHINTVETDPGKYNIVINSFDYYDLFKIGDLTPEQYCDGYTTYYDLAKQRLRQMKEVLTNKEDVIEMLGLRHETKINYNRNSVTINDLVSGNVTIDTLDGDTTRDMLWQGLKDEGFTDAAIAGILGNLQVEHGFSTSWSGDQGSVGLAQWRGNRKAKLVQLATQLNMFVTDPEVQAIYLINYDLPSQLGGKIYAPTGNTVYEELKSTNDVEFATDIICGYFERPSHYATKTTWENSKHGTDSSVEGYKYYIPFDRYVKSKVAIDGKKDYWLDLDKRRAYAQAIYNKYHE